MRLPLADLLINEKTRVTGIDTRTLRGMDTMQKRRAIRDALQPVVEQTVIDEAYLGAIVRGYGLQQAPRPQGQQFTSYRCPDIEVRHAVIDGTHVIGIYGHAGLNTSHLVDGLRGGLQLRTPVDVSEYSRHIS